MTYTTKVVENKKIFPTNKTYMGFLIQLEAMRLVLSIKRFKHI